MKNTFSAMIVSGLVLLTAGSAVAETRVYVGGPTAVEERGRTSDRHGWSGHGRHDRGFDRDRVHRPRPLPPRVVIRERDRDADIAVGVMGLLGGIVVGSTIDNHGRIPVVRQYRDRYEPPRQILRPWSASWYRWCDARYRSFNPKTGTYRDFDGRIKFCEARG